jgi:hypothetical protein
VGDLKLSDGDEEGTRTNEGDRAGMEALGHVSGRSVNQCMLKQVLERKGSQGSSGDRVQVARMLVAPVRRC